MAGVSRNSEGQLESVEEQLRRVEVRIQIVEEQISGLEERILLVEEQVPKCSDDLERKFLLGKEAQLQGNEAQLRGKEAQLLDEKFQLLQGRDLGTEHDWLVQEVVVPDVPSGSCPYPRCSIKEQMYKLVQVEDWNVKGDIEEFFERADKRKHAYNIFVTSSTRKMSKIAMMEDVTVAIILSKLQHFLEKKQPQLKFRFSPQISLGSIEKRKDETDEANKTDKRGLNKGAKFSSELTEFCIMNPKADFILTLEEKNAVVVEVKNGGLGPDQGDPWHLRKAWTECSYPTGEVDPNCKCEVLGIIAAHGERLIRCISQLYDYMAA